VEKQPPKAEVLLVESDDDLRRLLRMLLQQRYTLAEVSTARCALEMLRHSPRPLVVLWDLWLARIGDQHMLDLIEREPAVQAHEFLLLTSDQEGLSATLRSRLNALQVPLIGMPFDVDDLLRHIAAARQRAAVRIRAAE
jgi:DNA-binding NtrC family response regulator